MSKIVLIVFGIFCLQHLIRDYLQDRGVKNWYTTFAHFSPWPDTALANHIGMAVFLVVGCSCLYLAFHTS